MTAYPPQFEQARPPVKTLLPPGQDAERLFVLLHDYSPGKRTSLPNKRLLLRRKIDSP